MFAYLGKRSLIAVLAICAVLALLAVIDRQALFDPSCRETSAKQITPQKAVKSESAKDECRSVVVDGAYKAVDWMRLYKDEINAISTLALAAFTLVLLIFTISLRRSLRGPAVEAKAPAVEQIPAADPAPLPVAEAASQPKAEAARLFVEIVDETLSSAVSTWLQFTPTMKDGADIHAAKTVRLKFRNFGRSPAILKEIAGEILIAASLPEVPHYKPISDMPQERMLSEQGQTELITLAHDDDTPAAQALPVTEGTESLFVFGRVIYDDIFGTEHEHRFLFTCNGVNRRLTFKPDPVYTRNT